MAYSNVYLGIVYSTPVPWTKGTKAILKLYLSISIEAYSLCYKPCLSGVTVMLISIAIILVYISTGDIAIAILKHIYRGMCLFYSGGYRGIGYLCYVYRYTYGLALYRCYIGLYPIA